MKYMNKHRQGEFEAMQFSALLPRCKELFFEFLQYDFPYATVNTDKILFPYIHGFYIPDDIKSPIEQILYFAFELLSFCYDDTNIELSPQEPIFANGNNYRVDFLFDTKICEQEENQFEGFNTVSIVIECDGHEFHEKTKAQVTRDNKRDHDLKFAGYDVLHYNGSQIYNEPFKCAKEIRDYIVQQLGVKKDNGNI